jgi:hypothetical protein
MRYATLKLFTQQNALLGMPVAAPTFIDEKHFSGSEELL